MAPRRQSYSEALARPARSHAGNGAPAQDSGLTQVRAMLSQAHFDCGPAHPLVPAPNESLPRGTFRNFQGILVRGTIPFTLAAEDQETVAQELPFLTAHVVIACVVEGDLQGQASTAWWASLQQVAAPGAVNFHRRVGLFFTYVRTDGQVTINRLLAQGIHSYLGGTVLYQPWRQGFNPRMSMAVSSPMWVSFPNLPLEYQKLAPVVSAQIGSILAEHRG